MLKRIFPVLVVSGISLFQSACSLKVDSPQIKVDPPQINGPQLPNLDDLKNKAAGFLLSCSASLPQNSGGTVNPNEAAAITVQGSGGVAPYAILDSTSYFASSTVISRTYTNTTGQNRTVTDTVTLRDSLGLTATCSFVVTVLPENNASNLACQLTASPASPHLNTNFALSSSASGGTGPYTFEALALSADGIVVTPLSASGSATVKYSAAGLRTASVTVRDSTNNTVTCSRSITVRPALSVSALPTPGASAPAGNVITVNASSAGFLGTPSYSFSTTETGVSVTGSGSTATVTAADGLTHSFSVLVTATSQGETASTSVALAFTPGVPLYCSLTHPTGTYLVGENVIFSAVSNTGEALEITQFTSGSGGSVQSSTDSTRTVSYAWSGSKYVSATAKSKTRNVQCNAGAWISDFLSVNQTLSCSVATNPNPSYTYELVDVRAYVASNSGVWPVWVSDIWSSWDAYFYQWTGSLSADIYFANAGVFPVSVRVRDSAGHTATCSTTHFVDEDW